MLRSLGATIALVTQRVREPADRGGSLQTVLVAQGLNVFRTPIPKELAGTDVAEAKFSEEFPHARRRPSLRRTDRRGR